MSTYFLHAKELGKWQTLLGIISKWSNVTYRTLVNEIKGKIYMLFCRPVQYRSVSMV